MHTQEGRPAAVPQDGEFLNRGAGLAWLLPRGLATLKSLWLGGPGRLRAIT